MAAFGRLGAAVAPPATSDQPATNALELTWPEIARLVERHPRLAASKLQIDAARAGVAAAGAVPNPTLEGTVGKGVARAGDASAVEWSLAISVPLGWIAQRGSRIAAAEAEVEVVVAEGSLLRRDLLLQLRTLFWSLIYEQARVAALAALEAQTAALVQTVKKRVEKGEARPVAAIRAEIELERVGVEVDAARSSLAARQAALALWLGVPAGQRLVAVADLEALPVALDRDAALSRAGAGHPAPAAARARSRLLEAEVNSEKMARLPSFSLSGFTSHELDRRALGGGLAIDLPLWNWGSGRIAQAEARLAAGRELAGVASLEVAASVLDAQAACQTSVATATRLRNNLVPRSESAASTMEKTYQLGETGLLEVIDARRSLLDSRRLYLSALAQAQADCSRLGALVGEEPR